MKKHDIEFDVFVVVWNRTQGMGTPKIHIKMARWLERQYKAGNTELLLMAFRACGKSTLVGLFCAWVLYHNPSLRIIVVAADLILARKMVRNVKKIIERHPVTHSLVPKNPDQWGADQFTIQRSVESRDPSMLARSVSANMTGSRADIIICDDVEVPATCDTAEKRDSLRDALAELDFIRVRGGVILYVGTPHHFHSIYKDERLCEKTGETAFLKNYSRLVLPILNQAGESQWPERFPLHEIDSMRIRTGANKFQSQMMLEPVSINEGRLNPDDLVIYQDNLNYHEANGTAQLHLNGKKLISATCWWDPSFHAHSASSENKRGDASVIAIVFTDDSGVRYLHAVHYITYDARMDRDEATQQIDQVIDFAARYYVPAIHIESNGVGRFLPSLLRTRLAAQKKAISVIEASTRRAKNERILEAFEAIMAARALCVHHSVMGGPFADELREWRPSATHQNDDGLDAVAGALLAEPLRLKSHFMKRENDWRGTHSYQAPTDF